MEAEEGAELEKAARISAEKVAAEQKLARISAE